MPSDMRVIENTESHDNMVDGEEDGAMAASADPDTTSDYRVSRNGSNV
jgi:hypothetical protein